MTGSSDACRHCIIYYQGLAQHCVWMRAPLIIKLRYSGTGSLRLGKAASQKASVASNAYAKFTDYRQASCIVQSDLETGYRFLCILQFDLDFATQDESLYQASPSAFDRHVSTRTPPQPQIITQNKMTAMTPHSLSLGMSMSSPASASSATSSHPVLSRASSQNSLTSGFTTDSELSSDTGTAPHVSTEPTAFLPLQRICFVGGGYVGKPSALNRLDFIIY